MDKKEHSPLTYSLFNNMITWWYNIAKNSIGYDMNIAKERAFWFAEIVSLVVNALPGFAGVNQISVSTDSEGDDSLVLKTITSESLYQIDQFLRNTKDVTDIDIDLGLLCSRAKQDNSLEDFSISGRCWLVIENNFSENNSMYLEQAPASIRLVLGTDIYSPFTFGPLRDNRALAELNGPRLRSFLHRLHDILPLTIAEINEHCYAEFGLLDEYGFKMPDDLAALEKRLHS